ncbi:MAG: polyprenyl synthetase family protein [Paracoccaceae bacterium]
MNFPDLLAADAKLIQSCLDQALRNHPDQPVIHAMRYALKGGKRLRGFLVLESARLFGIPPETAIHAAAAVEALHAYSLIHDDLPAMDNDDLRRGLPTVHRKWNEATAILAGDALQTLAFELLTDPALGSTEVRIALIQNLAKASGAEGMVLGQALDMAAESNPNLSLQDITTLQAGKTGALIRFAAEAGAIIASQNPAPLRTYATALGLAFQIADDILDVTGDPGKTGKRLHKDAAAGKATFVSLLGLEAAQSRAKSLVAEAEAALSPYPNAQNLIAAARFVITRES